MYVQFTSCIYGVNGGFRKHIDIIFVVMWDCSYFNSRLYKSEGASTMSVITISTTKTLRDGMTMPLFGFGCWNIGADEVVINAVKHAVKYGYRLFDTASTYKNEHCVGQVLKESGLKRDEYFVVSKLHPENHGYEASKENIRESVKKLDIGAIDLYIIHSPRTGKILDTWKAMIELKKEGLLKSIGVSNFNIQHLKPIIDSGMELPEVNQIEIHPWN